MATNKDTMFARIDTEINENKFYESMQHILTLVKRNALRKQYNESLETLYKYALVYLDKNQYVLAGELMDEYSKIGVSGSIKFTSQMVTNLLNVFETPWKTSPNKPSYKESKEYPSTMSLFTKFMNRAILWSKCEEYPHGNPELHRSLGEFYKYDKQYNKAQANLVYAHDVELLFELVNEWKKESDQPDGDLFYLRAVLMLLASRDSYNAKSFVYMIDYNLEDSKAPQSIQFAHLLTDACDPPNSDLFKELCETYKDVINSDVECTNLIKVIRDIYFNTNFLLPMGNESGCENPLSGFLRSFM